MRTSFLTLSLAAGLTLVSLNANAAPPVFVPARGPVVARSSMPPRADAFLRNHFPRERAQAVSRTRAGGFDVTLTNGVLVQFDRRGDWSRVVAARRGALPAHILPARAQDTLRHPQFRRGTIQEIVRRGFSFEVVMAEGRGTTRLIFNNRGDLLRR